MTGPSRAGATRSAQRRSLPDDPVVRARTLVSVLQTMPISTSHSFVRLYRTARRASSSFRGFPCSDLGMFISFRALFRYYPVPPDGPRERPLPRCTSGSADGWSVCSTPRFRAGGTAVPATRPAYRTGCVPTEALRSRQHWLRPANRAGGKSAVRCPVETVRATSQ